MNCKQGDLAVVVQSMHSENLGLIVKCIGLHLSETHDLDGVPINTKFKGPRWVIDKPLYSIRCGMPTKCYTAADVVLRPIRDNDGTDETLTWAGKPKAKPIIVPTDEEAARIAETVPNSHIKVVIRGVLVSEYYGQSTTNQPEGSQ